MSGDALPSVFLKPSTSSYMPEESYFTSNPEETYFTPLLNDNFDENENNVSEAEKWEIVRVFFSKYFS
jgi:hypothetical protein